MPATEVPEETLQLTLSLPKIVAQRIRAEVASGVYADATDYVESILLSETIFEPIDQDKLTRWIDTEGVRRLEAMKSDPSQSLTHEEFWSAVEAEDLGDTEANRSSEAV